MSEAQAVGLAFVGAAAVLGILAWFFIRRSRRFLAGARPATGTVLELVTRHGSEGGISYAPRVQFAAAEGTTHEFESSVARNPPGYEVGQSVKVLYEPGNPGQARIDSWTSHWFVPTLLGGMAVVFGAVGAALAALG